MSRSKYWSTSSPERDWDYVVIGSGMGGMTAAALLAKLGRRVLVLEQHYTPGGFTHSFRRKHWTWDVGVHAIGEVTRHSMTGRVLERLTGGRLKWASLGPVYDEFHWPDGFRIDFPDSPEQFRANLVAAFPDEERAIDRYLALTREVASSMKAYYLARIAPKALSFVTDRTVARKAQTHFERNTAEVVAELTDDPRLRALFTAQWGYYGSVPSRSSFAIQALVVKHFWHGAYYPVGGSQRIAEGLLATVADAGGWTRIRADVEEIVIEGGAACGVRLKGGEVIKAKRVISAAGIQSTVRRLLPASALGEWADGVAALRPASAHVILHLGFEGDIREAGAGAANKWFYETWDPESPGWDVTDPDAEAPCLYCSFPSLKDPEHDPGPQQRHTGEVVTFVPWEVFEPWRGERWRHRGDDYEALKSDLEARLLRQFLGHMPGLADKVAYVELGTPASTDTFCRPMAGSIYGIEPTPERFRNPWLRPRSPVKNLFFAGSEVCSVGVIGAMMGGLLGAAAAEPRQVLGWLRGV